ncbi:GDP-L-fucose synthase [Dongia rigui]|uniref:GDP-L-fucose synthase n=1 Tax=Dongia rigui TaxID=940149 RepID=A0ABU5E3M5_9PROT|nr:GDP-L-fucose synthase [Dongia rigui]MDY0873799.1 GDP-L-fucose synthase [Dongia rigui]
MSAVPATELRGARIWVAGHRGMVGSAIQRRLAREDCSVLTVARAEADLRDPHATLRWMKAQKPDIVFVAAAKVGGILENSIRPAEFLLDNLAIENSIIAAAHEIGVRKLLFLGSSCVYPKMAPQPIQEESLLTGPLEPTNEWYAIAKIAGLKLCQAYRRQYGSNFISCMPTNLYGPNDNFDLQSSHVLPALLRKIHEAKVSGAAEVPIWGSGEPRREFLHVDDLADACVFLIQHYEGEIPLNVGTGSDVTIAELAGTIADIVGYRGRFAFDRSKPDGTPRKLLDVSRLSALGWQAKTDLRSGIAATYDWYLANARAA